MELSAFLNKLMADVNNQSLDIPAVLFGLKFLELGLRAKDRDIIRRVKLFKEFAFNLIEKRVSQLKEATANGKIFVKSGDMIESMYLANSLHREARSNEVYDYLELV